MSILSRSKLLPFYQRQLTGVIVFLFSLLLTTGSLHADEMIGSKNEAALSSQSAYLTNAQITLLPTTKAEHPGNAATKPLGHFSDSFSLESLTRHFRFMPEASAADFDFGSVQLAQAQPTTQLMTPEVSEGSADAGFFTYSWQSVANAVGYRYRLYNAAGLFKSGETTSVSLTYALNELPLGKYRLEVIALAPEGSQYSNSDPGMEVSRSTVGRFPEATTSEFVLSPVTTDSITLRIIDYPEALKAAFEPGETIGPTYHINLELNGERQGEEHVLGGEEVQDAINAGAEMFPDPLILPFENLMPDTNYEIVMVISSVSERFADSKPERFPARTLALRLPRPAGFMIEVGTTTAVLTWSESDAANANTYQISLDDQIQGEVPVANESYELTGLDASMESCLRIVARAPGFLDSPARSYRLKDGMASIGCRVELRLRLRAFLEGPLQ